MQKSRWILAIFILISCVKKKQKIDPSILSKADHDISVLHWNPHDSDSMENPLSTQSEIVRPDYFEKEAVKNLSKYKLLNEESWQKYQTLVEMILQASKSNKKGLVCQIKLEEVLYYLNLKSSSYQNIPPYVKIDSNRMNQLIKNGISDNMFDCLNYNLHFEYLQYYYALGKLNYLNGDFVEASNCFEQVLKSTRSKDLEQIKEVRELYKTCQSLIESP